MFGDASLFVRWEKTDLVCFNVFVKDVYLPDNTMILFVSASIKMYRGIFPK